MCTELVARGNAQGASHHLAQAHGINLDFAQALEGRPDVVIERNARLGRLTRRVVRCNSRTLICVSSRAIATLMVDVGRFIARAAALKPPCSIT